MKEASKAFFFEKKKQKTFTPLSRARLEKYARRLGTCLLLFVALNSECAAQVVGAPQASDQFSPDRDINVIPSSCGRGEDQFLRTVMLSADELKVEFSPVRGFKRTGFIASLICKRPEHLSEVLSRYKPSPTVADGNMVVMPVGISRELHFDPHDGFYFFCDAMVNDPFRSCTVDVPVATANDDTGLQLVAEYGIDYQNRTTYALVSEALKRLCKELFCRGL